ncbi:unnamed protein product [Rotaria sordida]|uniref:Uncharacterized protein n=1 Tax=Rotaria sordida TaxID=392033 RepID=A0A820GZD5_9BILA|nr:unnamed protein product [Rotaria sordida]
MDERYLFIIACIHSIPLFFQYEIIQMASVLQMIHIDNQSPSLLIDEEFLRNSMLVTKCYNDLAKRRLYRWTYMFFNVISVYTLSTITIFF